MAYPILYSLQHCPYAMRARMGIILAQQSVRLRAIDLREKPVELLQVSAKATVPVLVVDEVVVIDESLDIMLWALQRNDPANLLYANETNVLPKMLSLIAQFDDQFKSHLEKYKCAKRYHEKNIDECREQCELLIEELEQRLNEHQFIMGNQLSLVDYAILPYIRQFARVDKKKFNQATYKKVAAWLRQHLDSAVFSKTMVQYPFWLENREEFLFGKS
jgi:glutathione S-transferase